MNKLSIRQILPQILIVVLLNISMVALLNYFKFESSLKDLQKSRISLILNQTNDTMERIQSLGAQFTENTALESLIIRQKNSDPIIDFIDIYNDKNEIIMSTNRVRKGVQLDTGLTEKSARSRHPEWFSMTTQNFVAGRDVLNSFGERMGKIIIHYDRGDYERKTSTFMLELIKCSTMVSLLCLFICIVGLNQLARRVSADFDEAQRLIGPNSCIHDKRGSTLSAAVAAAYGKIQQAEGRIARISELLRGSQK